MGLSAALAAAAVPCGAQVPAEVAGRVLDALAGVPVAGARVVVSGGLVSATTDAAGAFVLRGIDPGRHTLHVARRGYADTAVVAVAANGSDVAVWIRLRPLAEALDGIDVRAAAADGVRIEAAAIARSGARTAGDVVATAAGVAAGVVVRSTGAGGAQTASIRGSDPAAVLVLVDGAALNDPVTGVADLSEVAAASIETVTVLPGARSARYGPRAQAGVILIETRRASAMLEAEAFAGSLGARGVRAQAGGGAGSGWLAGGSWRAVGGGFTFALPAAAGGGTGRRVNADATAAAAYATAAFALAGGAGSVRGGVDRLERGLPGRGFAPSAAAREALERARAAAYWGRSGADGAVEATLAWTTQRTRIRDDDPPSGLPYDDSARFTQVEARVTGERGIADGRAALGGGVDARAQHIRSTQLAPGAPSDRRYAGAFAHARAGSAAGRGRITVDLEARLDHDPAGGAPVASHAATLRYAAGGAAVHVAHRSSYAPPGLDDQFFRDAVGVEPNPDLRAERVPGEVEVRATVAHVRGGTVATAAVAAYAGDVRDMIVWVPDFRFVWSPRNLDVRRRGLEVSAALERAGAVRALRASWALARVTYAAADDAQLAYRPRHTAQLRAEWARQGFAGALDARYTGTRYPAAARVNALPGFWTLGADIERTWRAGDWTAVTSLRVDRLLDETDTLIFGFPDPGRVAELRVRIARPLPRQGRNP